MQSIEKKQFKYSENGGKITKNSSLTYCKIKNKAVEKWTKDLNYSLLGGNTTY